MPDDFRQAYPQQTAAGKPFIPHLAVRQAAASLARFVEYCSALTGLGQKSARLVAVGLNPLVVTEVRQGDIALAYANQASGALVKAVQALCELILFSQSIPAVA